MDRRAELLAAIFAEPDADAPRWVYADHLMSIGDPRGEFIALQLREVDNDRQRELLAAHWDAWSAPAGERLFFERGFCPWWGAPAAVLAERAAAVFACEPIVAIEVTREGRHASIAGLLARPELTRIRALSVGGWTLLPTDLAALAACEALAELEELNISGLGSASRAHAPYAPLLAAPTWRPRRFAARTTDASIAGSIAASPIAATLEHLDLSGTRLDNIGPLIARLARVTHLLLERCRLEVDAATALVAAPLTKLELLDVRGNRFSPDARAKLAERFGDRVLM